MNQSTMKASLYCIHCQDEELHDITYVNGKLYSVECESCHHLMEIEMNMMRELFKEVYKRIESKPTRMTQEYKEDLSEFLFSLPVRVISKPFRVIKELNEDRKTIHKLKDADHH